MWIEDVYLIASKLQNIPLYQFCSLRGSQKETLLLLNMYATMDDLRDVGGSRVGSALGMVCRVLLPPLHVTTFLFKDSYRYCVTNTSTGKSRGFNQIMVVHYCTALALQHTSNFRWEKHTADTIRVILCLLSLMRKISSNFRFTNCQRLEGKQRQPCS